MGKSAGCLDALFRKMHQRLLHLIALETLLDSMTLEKKDQVFVIPVPNEYHDALIVLLTIASQINLLKFLLEIKGDYKLLVRLFESKGYLYDWCLYLADIDSKLGGRQTDTVFKLLHKSLSSPNSSALSGSYGVLASYALRFYSQSSKFDFSVFIDQTCIYLYQISKTNPDGTTNL